MCKIPLKSKSSNFKEEYFLSHTNAELLQFIKKYSDVAFDSIEFIDTDSVFNISNNNNNCIVNIHRINDIRYINKFLEDINNRLSLGGTLICCVETIQARRTRKKKLKIPILNFIYFALEFIFLRVFPKISFLKSFYFTITRGKNRLLSKAETLGRLVSCGFEIKNIKTINGLLYIAVKKNGLPKYDMQPSYGPIYKMPRIGKNKKIINVYKLRTMHPYSEYLQGFISKRNGLSNGDKINNDFRITPEGYFFRKLWIDELPMIINVLKGDIKLVGVRPLSKYKFNLYPKDIQLLRTKFKPGLLPPFYADLPSNFDELVSSEVKYIKAYEKHPLRTDIKYFFVAFYNILFKGARSS